MPMLKSYPASTTTAEVEDFEQVVADPSAFYPDPAAVLADPGLDRGQRLRLLTEWAQDIVDRQVAENEGMGPETAAVGADETNLLRQVNAAIETVEASPAAPPGLLTRVWTRLIA
jgi:hypothetical protein